jgi:hypothetical protein
MSRLDKVVELLTAFALGEVTLSEKRVEAALALLNFAIPDAPRPDDGAEVLMSAFAFPRKFSS